MMCLARAPLFKFRTINDPGGIQQEIAGGCLLRAARISVWMKVKRGAFVLLDKQVRLLKDEDEYGKARLL